MTKKTQLPCLSRADFYRLKDEEFLSALAGAIAKYADQHPRKKLTAHHEAMFAWSRRSPRGISLDCIPMTKRISSRPLVVRDVRPDDAEAILGILNPIIESGAYSALDTPFSVEDEREFIRNFPQRGVFHLAEESGEQRVVGFQTLEPFAAYTRAFDHVGVVATFVKMARRGRGVGRCLAEATFEQARRKGYEKLFTFVRADNPDALRFYRALGFRVIGTAARQAKIRGKYVDEVIIEKFL